MMILKPSLFWIGGENADVYVRTINEFKTPKRGIKVFCEVCEKFSNTYKYILNLIYVYRSIILLTFLVESMLLL